MRSDRVFYGQFLVRWFCFDLSSDGCDVFCFCPLEWPCDLSWTVWICVALHVARFWKLGFLIFFIWVWICRAFRVFYLFIFFWKTNCGAHLVMTWRETNWVVAAWTRRKRKRALGVWWNDGESAWRPLFFMWCDEGYFGKFAWHFWGVIWNLVLPFWFHGLVRLCRNYYITLSRTLNGQEFLIFFFD